MSFYQKGIGKTGESRAEIFLKDQGFSILKSNFQSKVGEIDIIAEKNHYLYFIEVKTRTNTKFGQPYVAVDKRKIHHMKQAANYFLLKYPHKDYKLRLAVISIIFVRDKEEIKFFDNIY